MTASPNQSRRRRPFTGWHMFAILFAGFGVVVAVNFAMAHYALSTFGGEVVENSYVASQDFNRWLDEAAREKALGWKLTAIRRADGKVEVALAGVPAYPTVKAEARHPLGKFGDIALTFRPDGKGHLVSRETLPDDRWTLRFDVEAGGHRLRAEREIR